MMLRRPVLLFQIGWGPTKNSKIIVELSIKLVSTSGSYIDGNSVGYSTFSLGLCGSQWHVLTLIGHA